MLSFGNSLWLVVNELFCSSSNTPRVVRSSRAVPFFVGSGDTYISLNTIDDPRHLHSPRFASRLYFGVVKRSMMCYFNGAD